VHELSVCQHLIGQVEALAREHGAVRVSRIVVRIGPLAGVEAALLEQAFTLARAGTVADQAELATESLPIQVRCTVCGAVTTVTANRLICGACGDWHTELQSGDELLLTSVELELEDNEYV